MAVKLLKLQVKVGAFLFFLKDNRVKMTVYPIGPKDGYPRGIFDQLLAEHLGHA